MSDRRRSVLAVPFLGVLASLRDRMLQLGSTPVQIDQLESLLREALSGGGLSQHSAAASNAIQVMSEAYASGLAGTMLGVALIVGLLGAISLLLLVIGHRQQRTEVATQV